MVDNTTNIISSQAQQCIKYNFIGGPSSSSSSNNFNKICNAPFSTNEDGDVIKEQDRLLPIANVGRIMKKTLPPNAKISKEAKETMQECVSEFIGFVTGEASDKCLREKRKTVNGDDVCWALASLGFDEYVEPLKRYLYRFRELEGERASQNKGGNNYNISNIEEKNNTSKKIHRSNFNF